MKWHEMGWIFPYVYVTKFNHCHSKQGLMREPSSRLYLSSLIIHAIPAFDFVFWKFFTWSAKITRDQRGRAWRINWQHLHHQQQKSLFSLLLSSYRFIRRSFIFISLTFPLCFIYNLTTHLSEPVLLYFFKQASSFYCALGRWELPSVYRTKAHLLYAYKSAHLVVISRSKAKSREVINGPTMSSQKSQAALLLARQLQGKLSTTTNQIKH